MRAVVQRVSSAHVAVGDRVTGRIGHGLLVFLGVEEGDDPADVTYMSGKIAGLRIFDEAADAVKSRMTRSVSDVDGAVLLVSQFTLCGDCRKGRRPSFDHAERPEIARGLFESVAAELRVAGVPVETGEFQALMRVESVNDGPVTLLLDSRRTF